MKLEVFWVSWVDLFSLVNNAYISPEKEKRNVWKIASTGLFIVLSLETERRTLQDYSRLQNQSRLKS